MTEPIMPLKRGFSYAIPKKEDLRGPRKVVLEAKAQAKAFTKNSADAKAYAKAAADAKAAAEAKAKT